MRLRVYDWDALYAKRRFRLLRGRDYDCGTASAIQQARTHASRRGLSISVVEDQLGFTVTVKGKRHAKVG